MTDVPDSPLPLAPSAHQPRIRRPIVAWLRANLFASIPSSIITCC